MNRLPDDRPTRRTRRTDDQTTAVGPANPRPTFEPHRTGDLIGRYRIVSRLGEGGFGVVYLAEQDEPVARRVALKIIKPGMDSGEIVARFEAERRSLAVMEHHGIAALYDAGATGQGLPYFVMELVRGDPITAFCDANRLSVRDRIMLVMQAARAVHHAHGKGVVHRDLKPANLLAGYDGDGRATVKVIDFGVAKALTYRPEMPAAFTARGTLIGSPDYMSPEQANLTGADIDARADIYSLSVVLYELLIGLRPFDLQPLALEDIRRFIAETPPVPPSRRLLEHPDVAHRQRTAERRQVEAPELVRELEGGLDWVIMRGMEHDRERRYASCLELADELQRHLDGEPLHAQPPSHAARIVQRLERAMAPIEQRSLLIGAVALPAVLTGLLLSMWWSDLFWPMLYVTLVPLVFLSGGVFHIVRSRFLPRWTRPGAAAVTNLLVWAAGFVIANVEWAFAVWLDYPNAYSFVMVGAGFILIHPTIIQSRHGGGARRALGAYFLSALGFVALSAALLAPAAALIAFIRLVMKA